MLKRNARSLRRRKSQRAKQSPRVRLEKLEARLLLNSDWQNPGQELDVNDDLVVSAMDALAGINRFYREGPGPLGHRSPDSNEFFFDTNGDGAHSEQDILRVINALFGFRPLAAARLSNDTAPGDSTNRDLLTNDPSVTIARALGPPSVLKAGFNDPNPDAFVEVASNALGMVQLDSAQLATIHGSPIPDGQHTLYAQAVGVDTTSEVVSLSFTLDTTPPADIQLALAPVSDSVPLGDGETEHEVVSFVGRAPLLTFISLGDLSTVAAEDGQFTLTGVPLAMGENHFQIDAEDAAGNRTTVTHSVTRIAPLNQPPINTVPAAEAVRVNQPLLLSTNTDITVVDPDVLDNDVYVQLEASHGTLTIGDREGLDFSPTWETAWAAAYGSDPSAFHEARDAVFDQDGNLYVVGAIRGTVPFKPGNDLFTVSAAGFSNSFILKVDPNGEPVWVRALEGLGGNGARSVDLDADNNLLITGFFSDTVDFDPGSGTAELTENDASYFLLKLDERGEFVWVRQTGGGDNITPFSVKTDADGNVYTTGNFRGSIDLDPGPGFFSRFSNDTAGFLQKLDSNGNFQWAFSLAGNRVLGHDIAFDGAGNPILVGEFAGFVDFDPTFRFVGRSGPANGTTFAAQYTADGALDWVSELTVRGQASNRNSPSEVAVDAAGNVLVTGHYQGETDFDPGTAEHLLSTPEGSFSNESRAYLWRLTPQGGFGWVWALESGDSSFGTTVGVDANGLAYVAGTLRGSVTVDTHLGPVEVEENPVRFRPNYYVAQIAEQGDARWIRKLAGDGSLTIWGGDVSDSGQVAIAARLSGSVDADPSLGEQLIEPPTGPDGLAAFVLSLESVVSDGVDDSTISFAGTLSEINQALASTTFTPHQDFSGYANVKVFASDLGGTGRGGPLNDTAQFVVTVSDPVTFEDPYLREQVRSGLGLAPSESVNTANITGLRQLSLDSNRVASLGGLESARNLETLELTPSDYSAVGPLEDFSPVASLPNLQNVTAIGLALNNDILAQLATIEKLRTLDVRYSQVDSLAPLAQVRGLRDLSIYGNPVEDVSPLAGNLIRIDVSPERLDLAATPSEIAAALHHLPLAAFEFVRNKVDYQAYAGAQKGPQATLETHAGNAWDQAWLLLEILRASGINARFAVGRAQRGLDDIESWLGMSDAGAAAAVLSQAGLNPTVEFRSLTFDHAWVAADLPAPSGGTQTIWLDPSWKFKDRQPGVPDLLTKVPFDEDAFLAQTTTDLPLEFYEKQVAQYLQENTPAVSISQVPFDGPIIPVSYTEVPETDFFSTSQVVLHESLPPTEVDRYRVRLMQGLDQLLTFTLSLPEVALDRVTLHWSDIGNDQLRPELRLGTQLLATGTATGRGTPVALIADHLDRGDDVVDFSSEGGTGGFAAGTTVAVTFGAKQLSAQRIAQYQSGVNQISIDELNGTPHPLNQRLGAFLHLAGARYLHLASSSEQRLGLLTSYVAADNRPAVALTGSKSDEIAQVMGLPSVHVPVEAELDVIISSLAPSPVDGNIDTRDEFARLVGWNGSALEHALWEELIVGEGISTVKSLQLAAERGIPRFEITPANRESILPQLSFGLHQATIMADISARLDTGSTIVVPQQNTPLNNWDGVGFLDVAPGVDSTTLSWIIHGATSSATAQVINGGTLTQATDLSKVNDVDSGPAEDRFLAGDPIDIASGNVTRDELDLSIPAIGIPFEFARRYSSQSSVEAGLGAGWSHSYSDRLATETDGSVIWTTNRGYRYRFVPDGSGGFVTPVNLYGVLSSIDTDGMRYREKDGLVHEFDSAGRLIRLRDRNGQGMDLQYDAQGQLLAVVDADATDRRLTFNWSDGRIAAVSDFTGRTWSYSYESGQLTGVAGPEEGDAPSYSVGYEYYDGAALGGLLQRITEPDGGVIEYEYYPNRWGFRVTAPEGYRHALFYNQFRNQSEFLDERGLVTDYFHNASGNLIRTVFPDRSWQEETWQEGLRTSTTDGLSNTEIFEYDAAGNLVRHTDALGEQTTVVYEPTFSRPAETTRPGGRVTRQEYDDRGNQIRTEDALGNVTLRSFDERGLLLSQTSPNGTVTAPEGDYTTTFTYDDAGNALTMTTDLPSVTSLAYDQRGNLLSATDANGHTATYAYDVLNRLVRSTDPLQHEASIDYDAVGNIVALTDARGHTTEMSYDHRQLLTGVTHPDGSIESSLYDAAGNLVSQWDALGRRTDRQYDQRNRRIVERHPDGTTERMFFDGNGRLAAERDERGNATVFAYDPEGRLTNVIDAHGGVSSIAYDGVGNVVQQTDRRGAETHFTYDLLDRLVELRGPENGAAQRQYDANGNLVAEISYDLVGLDPIPVDLSGMAAERTRRTSFVYDVRDRLTGQTDPLGQVSSLLYDPGGRLVEQIDEAGRSTKFEYDAADRLVTVIDALGGKTSQEYDALGNLTQLQDPLERSTQYAYDPRNRLISVVDAAGGSTRTNYDRVGNPILETDVLGRPTRLEYDSRNRATAAIDPLGQMTQFSYDAGGNLLRVTDARGVTTAFGYDRLNRVAARFTPDGQTRFLYDREGNPIRVVDPLFRSTLFENDLLGRPVTITDPTGEMTTFTYDGFGNVVATADALERTTQFEYDPLDRLVSTVDALGNTTQLEYDVVGNQIRRIDPLGRSTSFEYDELDRLTGTTDALGGLRSQTYDAVGNRISTTDELGRTTLREFDLLDRVVAVTDPLNGVERAEYDAAGNVIKSIDALGRETHFSYDVVDQLTVVTDALGHQTSFTYDAVGNVVETIDALGRATQVAYDHENRPLEVVDAAGGVSLTEYDRVGNVIVTTDALGRTTEFEYDRLNRLVLISDPLGNTTAFTYDAVGNRTSTTDALGNDTLFGYDELNRPVSATDALGFTSTTRYDGVGNVVETIDAGGRSTTFGFDPLNRLLTVTDPLGNVDTNDFDAVGNLVQRTDALGRDTRFVYDAGDRLRQIIDTLGNSTTHEYDAVGNRVATTDALGQATLYSYDALDRLTGVTDPLGGVTATNYDALGNVASLTDPVGNVTSYAYDVLDRVVRETNQLGDSRHFEYDLVGNLTRSVDRNGRIREFTYDALNRQVVETWQDELGRVPYTAAYAYDALGRLTSAGDDFSEFEYIYDVLGRLAEATSAVVTGSPEVGLAFSYDAVGNLTQRNAAIEANSVGSTWYLYDDNDRLTRMWQDGEHTIAKAVDFFYNELGQFNFIVRYASVDNSQLVARTRYRYDDLNRLRSLVHADEDFTTISEFGYQYDELSRIVRVVDNDAERRLRATDFAYDATGQLLTATSPARPDESFSYDSNGNRTLPGYDTGEDNQLLSDGRYDYGYDAEGNRVRRTNIATGQVTEYRYDHRNRLVAVTDRESADGNATQRVEYAYDIFDRRISRSIDEDGAGPLEATRTTFAYDGEHVLFEFDNSGDMSNQYLHGPLIDQVLAAESADGETTWALTDHQNTVRDLVDSDGAVLSHLEYGSFGEVISETNLTVDFLFGYTGRERDDATGLHYYRARWMDPEVGRFLSQDPIQFSGGDTNLYRYVSNDPLNSIDPSGQRAKSHDQNVQVFRDPDGRVIAIVTPEGRWARDANGNLVPLEEARQTLAEAEAAAEQLQQQARLLGAINNNPLVQGLADSGEFLIGTTGGVVITFVEGTLSTLRLGAEGIFLGHDAVVSTASQFGLIPPEQVEFMSEFGRRIQDGQDPGQVAADLAGEGFAGFQKFITDIPTNISNAFDPNRSPRERGLSLGRGASDAVTISKGVLSGGKNAFKKTKQRATTPQATDVLQAKKLNDIANETVTLQKRMKYAEHLRKLEQEGKHPSKTLIENTEKLVEQSKNKINQKTQQIATGKVKGAVLITGAETAVKGVKGAVEIGIEESLKPTPGQPEFDPTTGVPLPPAPVDSAIPTPKEPTLERDPDLDGSGPPRKVFELGVKKCDPSPCPGD